MPTNYFLTMWTRDIFRESFPRFDRCVAIFLNEFTKETSVPLCLYSKPDWVNWKYLATVVSGARSWRAPGTRIQNIGEPCGWHERKQARRRGTNAKEEARFLRGESGSIRLPGQPSPRLTHPVPANHEIFCVYISLRYYLL